jgi:hypothetical protein
VIRANEGNDLSGGLKLFLHHAVKNTVKKNRCKPSFTLLLRLQLAIFAYRINSTAALLLHFERAENGNLLQRNDGKGFSRPR